MNECKNLNIKINKPKDVKQFDLALSKVKEEKKKASNLLFEELE